LSIDFDFVFLKCYPAAYIVLSQRGRGSFLKEGIM
jgi:hypothetical protein